MKSSQAALLKPSAIKRIIEIDRTAMRWMGAGMKITSLISGKRVETISPSASVHDLVNALNTHHVGAMVVSVDGKRIDGIVSERDVVRAMPGKLDQLINMHVRDLMTVEPQNPKTPKKQAINL